MEIGRHFSLRKQAHVNVIKSLGAELLLFFYCADTVRACQMNAMLDEQSVNSHREGVNGGSGRNKQ